MGCFSGRLMSAASDQKLFCKLCSPFCCSFDEFVEEKVISRSYSSAILTPPPSLLLNMLSRLVISFLPRSKRLFISWLQSPSAVILEPPNNKVWHCFHCLPIYFPWGDGTRCHDLSFKLTFSLSSFTFIKRLFSISSLSAIRVVSSAYLRLLIFLPAILIPACASSSPAFLMRKGESKRGESNQASNHTPK